MAKRKPKDPGLAAAINAAGTARELARRIGVSPAAISVWPKVPVNRVRPVERATGVHRTVLRPDIFADDDDESTGVALDPASFHTQAFATR
jgi:DNA-binding transcriptional regulator YdaS (Cro superfamily)